MRRALALALLSAILLSACADAPRVVVRVTNVGAQPVREIELDYGRMFGVAELRPREARQRVVNFSDAVELQLRFYDGSSRLHSSKGPRVEAGSSGEIEARIGDGGKVEWAAKVTR